MVGLIQWSFDVLTQTRERPIIFSGEMVRAILDGRKMQTRRVVKWKRWPDVPVESMEGHHVPFRDSPANECIWTADHVEGGGIYVEQDIRCPYGLVGDRLWVREAWQLVHVVGRLVSGMEDPEEYDECLESWEGSIPKKHPGDTWYVDYKAGMPPDFMDESWRSPIFMPRWASRITLEITDVRVQRAHEITEDDAIAEGIGPINDEQRRAARTLSTARRIVTPARTLYESLWDSLNVTGG